MSGDMLQQAAQALREETRAPGDCAPFTRGRVMASLHRGKRRRRWHVALLVPIAAVLGGSTALAAWGGEVRWQAVAQAIGLDPAGPPPPPARPGHAAPRRTVSPSRMSPVQPAAPTLAAPTLAAPPPASARAAAAVVPQPPVGGRPWGAASRASDPELELYRRAHRAHFAQGDPAQALSSWDEYLQRMPRGRFALEARYNRAICLTRLGRHADAEHALEPFANGTHGAYRRDDARALLEALRGSAAPSPELPGG
jgi:hypothetical protein